MRAVDIIIKKRDQKELTREEIDFFINGFTRGEIPDYQASAWAMAILLNGMSPRETTDLTLAMAQSGEVLDLSRIVPNYVDKHSSGGIGDKTTLVVGPMVSACGLPVGKMSGRGLGISGGTIDKLESIPGFCANLTTEEFLGQLRTIGLVVTGQSTDLAPADGKLYALRDVTGTVQSIPLIASSIMSKKIAGGAKAIVLDVKVGSGAFMKTLEDAKELATLMVDIGKLSERKTLALLSDMNQPLGFAVGNALELEEAIQVLQGEGPPDFIEHCLTIAEHMLMLGGKATENKEARSMAKHVLADGSAWDSFRKMVIAQKGDVNYIDNPSLLPKARYVESILSPSTGYLSGINAQMVGEAAVLLGAGRAKKGDAIDYAVGVEVHRKVGDYVKKDQPLFTIHANDENKLQQGCGLLLAAHTWSSQSVEPLPLFYEIIS